jgi:rhodanese-related sulfurtransferase
MFLPTINSTAARALVRHGAQLVDVRDRHEYLRASLPGSVNIPLSSIQLALKQLDKKTPVLVCCNNGQRSGKAKRLLEACGFALVHNLGSYTTLVEHTRSDDRKIAHKLTQ